MVVVIFISLIGILLIQSNAFMLPSASRGWSRTFKHVKASFANNVLKASVSVGDQVMAEVDDIIGTAKDPIISFLIQHKGDTLKAVMPTKNLSPTERLAMQAGTVMQMFVTDIDNDVIKVSNKPSGKTANNYQPSKEVKPQVKQPRVVKNEEDLSIEDLMGEPTTKDQKSYQKSTTQQPMNKRPTKTSTLAISTLPENGFLLNNLKTGMKLEGKVVGSSSYTSYIQANVFRKGKGASFMPVSGVLQKSDLPMPLRKALITASGLTWRGNELLPKGLELSVYVKEVYKNSGRLILTTDGGVNKDKMLNEKEEKRQEGKKKRRTQRLRVQLSNVFAGDLVNGFVKKIIPEGVLITITSLGPMNVTGLLSKRDMPKQFEVPSDLKDNFQAQLLGQDFVVNRPISCTVSKISDVPNLDLTYNLRVLFEKFGPMPEDYDDFEINDKGEDILSLKNDDENEETDDDDDDFGDLSDDVVEIYNELKGTKEFLSVQDVFDWADIQDMIAENTLTLEKLKSAFFEIGVTKIDSEKEREGKGLSLMQFQELVFTIQDFSDSPLELDDLDDETDDDDDDSTVFVDSLKDTIKDTLMDQNPATSDMKKEKIKEIVEESMEDAIKEMFNELKGKEKELTVKKLKTWSELAFLLEDGLLTKTQILENIKDIVGSNDDDDVVTYSNFEILVENLDKIASETADAEKETAQVEVEAKEVEVEEGSEEEEEEDMISPEDVEEVLIEVFNELKGKNGLITVKELLKWDDLKEMLEEEIITKSKIEEFYGKVLESEEKGLDFDNFRRFVDLLDDLMDEDDYEDDTDEEVDDVTEDYLNSIKDDDDDDKTDDDDDDDEIDSEYVEELYNELKGSSKLLTTKQFKKWEEIQDLLKDDLISENTLDVLIKEVQELVDEDKTQASSLTLDQFNKLTELVSEMVEMDEEDSEEGLEEDSEVDSDDDFEDDDDYEDEEEATEEELEAMARELFDELKSDSTGKVSEAKFMKWETVQDEVKNGGIKADEVKKIVRKVVGTEKNVQMKFEQFKEVMDLLEDLMMERASEGENKVFTENSVKPSGSKGFGSKVDDSNDDDDDIEDSESMQLTKEVFNDLRGKSKLLPIKKLREWEDLVEMIEGRVLSEVKVEQALGSLGPKRGVIPKELTLKQFSKFLDFIENSVDANNLSASLTDREDDDDEYLDDDEDDELLDDDEDDELLDDDDEDDELLDDDDELLDDDDEDDVDDDEEFEEESDEDTAREIFNDLVSESTGDNVNSAGKPVLKLDKFLEWEEIQMMLEENVLSKDQLAQAIQLTGLVPELDKAEKSDSAATMDFEMFYDLLQVIDGLVNTDDELPEKLSKKQTSSISLDLNDDDDDSSSKKGKNEKKKNNKKEIEESYNTDQEVKEMFKDLSGKEDFITEKKLRNWDELKEIIESGLVSKKSVDEYIKELKIPADGRITFPLFQKFMSYLDTVLVDDLGNILEFEESGKAVDVSDVDIDDF